MPEDTVIWDEGDTRITRRDLSNAMSFILSEGSDELEVFRFDSSLNALRIFPRIPSGAATLGFKDQFSQVKELRIHRELWTPSDRLNPLTHGQRGDAQLTGVPHGFGSTVIYGLGLYQRYRVLVRQIEEMTPCTIVQVGGPQPEGRSNEVFHLSLATFLDSCQAIDRNRDRATIVAKRVNKTLAQNILAPLLGVPAEPVKVGRHPLIQAMTADISESYPVGSEDREALIEVMAANSRQAAIENPTAFSELRNNVELVTLEQLIDEFERKLSSGGKEAVWQEFFSANPFALQQLFAAPLVLLGSEMLVRAPNASGAGSRRADFVLVNSLTRTVRVVEIKKPDSKLLNQTYRGRSGAEASPPSMELSGSVAQLQSQMQSASLDFEELVRKDPSHDSISTAVVRGAVIVGNVGTLAPEEKTSLELYRRGLNNVEVLGFDEVLERLRILRQMLTPRSSVEDETEAEADEDDVSDM